MGLALVVSPAGGAEVEVVLASYNGAAFLEAQVASIAAQTLRPRRLLVGDDRSSDGTVALLERLQQRYGPWLVLLPAAPQRLGCQANFERLLVASTAPYVALADQDDLWDADKLERSLALLQQLEGLHGAATPLLVHSDLRLMAADGRPLQPSFWRHQRLDPRRCTPADLALTNVVTGCTVLVNRACLERALPLPAEALMHDWWLALVAAQLGAIGWLAEATVRYRQHSANVLGATGVGWGYWWRRLRVLCAPGRSLAPHTLGAIRQRAALEQRFGLPTSPLVRLQERPRWRRLALLPQLPRKQGPLRQLAWLLLAVWMPAAPR